MSSILNLYDIRHEPPEDISTFYKKFKSIVYNNLKKKGCKISEGVELLEDEIISPTFEEVIILWFLEKVDNKFTEQVKASFGDQILAGVTVKDLQEDIFQHLSKDFNPHTTVRSNKVCDYKEVNVMVNDRNASQELESEIDRSAESLLYSDSALTLDIKHEKITSPYKKSLNVNASDIENGTNELLNGSRVVIYDGIKEEVKEGHLGKSLPNEDFEAKIECDSDDNENILDDGNASNDSFMDEDYKVEALDDDSDGSWNLDDHIPSINYTPIKSDLTPKEEGLEITPLVQADSLRVTRRRNQGSYKCDICGLSMANKRSLGRHYELIHNQQLTKNYPCKLCELDFESKLLLEDHRTKMHKRKYVKPKPVVCNLCGRSCAGKRRLKEHIFNRHSKSKTCNICNESFLNVDALKAHKLAAHKKIYQKPERVVCDTCGRSCAGPRRLKEHIKNRHSKDKKYKCRTCSQILDSLEEYKEHRKEEHPKKKEVGEMCPHCGKIVHSRLKRHILTHISNIACAICSEKFISQEDLDAHMQKHEENPDYRRRKERTIHCLTCKRTFVDEDDYKSHVCKHFTCDTCDMKFLMKRNLEMHKRFHAGETVYSCDLCESLFVNRKSLYCHKRASHDPDKRKHKCDECGKCFLNPSQLGRHKLIHSGIKPFKCATCDKSFRQKAALETHMNSHTGYKPFSCDTCDMRFGGLIEMKRHKEMNKCGLKEEDPSLKIES